MGEGTVPGVLARRVAGVVRQWLADGVWLDGAARAFLEAQLGLPGLAAMSARDAAAQLAPLLGAGPQERAGVDAEGALEYLLYPDAALRLSVERLLAEDTAAPCLNRLGLGGAILGLLPRDATAVLHLSDAPCVPTGPCVADAAGVPGLSGASGLSGLSGLTRLVVPAPRWTMALLVRRLRLDRVIPAPLAAAVARHLPEPQALALRLALRDARFDLAASAPVFSGNAASGSCTETTGAACASRPELVLRFIRRMPPSDPGYLEALTLWLDLLHDLPPGASAHAALSARRERLARAAREADEFMERLVRLNMEILMLQGVHAPALDADEARRRVRLMDRMCLAVLGRPAALDSAHEGMAPVGRDLGAFDPATGLDDLLRLLS